MVQNSRSHRTMSVERDGCWPDGYPIEAKTLLLQGYQDARDKRPLAEMGSESKQRIYEYGRLCFAETLGRHHTFLQAWSAARNTREFMLSRSRN